MGQTKTKYCQTVSFINNQVNARETNRVQSRRSLDSPFKRAVSYRKASSISAVVDRCGIHMTDYSLNILSDSI